MCANMSCGHQVCMLAEGIPEEDEGAAAGASEDEEAGGSGSDDFDDGGSVLDPSMMSRPKVRGATAWT